MLATLFASAGTGPRMKIYKLGTKALHADLYALPRLTGSLYRVSNALLACQHVVGSVDRDSSLLGLRARSKAWSGRATSPK